MKKVLMTILILVLAIGANAEMKPNFYLGGGLGMPMSPDGFTDSWEMGFNLNGGIGFELNPNIEIIGRFAYNTFPIDEDAWQAELEDQFDDDLDGITFDGGNINALEFGADLRYSFTMAEDAKFSPFLIAGAGMTSVSFSDLDGTFAGLTRTFKINEDATDISLNFGAGFIYNFSPKMGLFVDGRYVIILSEDESTAFFPIHVGLKIALGGE